MVVHCRPLRTPVPWRAKGEQRQHGRKKGHGQDEGRDDSDGDKATELTIGGHLGEVHAQESKGGREAREEDGVQVEPDGFDDGIVFRVAGAQPLLHGNQQVNAVGHDNHQDDGWRRGDGRGKLESHPGPQAHGGQYGKDDDKAGGHHARPAPDENAENQGHEKETGRQEDHLAFNRSLEKRLVDHHRADDAKINAGETRLCFRGCRSGEFRHFGHGFQLVAFRHFQSDVDNADIAVAGQHAAGDAGVGEGNVADA